MLPPYSHPRILCLIAFLLLADFQAGGRGPVDFAHGCH